MKKEKRNGIRSRYQTVAYGTKKCGLSMGSALSPEAADLRMFGITENILHE